MQSIDPSLGATNSYAAELEFIMQPLTAITPDNEDPTISEIAGWQANFVPVPEPSDVEIIVCGFAAVALLWRRRPGKQPRCRCW